MPDTDRGAPAPDRGALGLAKLLAVSGTAHFLVPRPFDSIVPRALPGGPRGWTRVSGAAELVLAAGIAAPATRRVAALGAAAFFVAVLPANVRMAYDWRHRSAPLRAVAYGRLPLQIPLVLRALSVARRAGRPADR